MESGIASVIYSKLRTATNLFSRSDGTFPSLRVSPLDIGFGFASKYSWMDFSKNTPENAFSQKVLTVLRKNFVLIYNVKLKNVLSDKLPDLQTLQFDAKTDEMIGRICCLFFDFFFKCTVGFSKKKLPESLYANDIANINLTHFDFAFGFMTNKCDINKIFEIMSSSPVALHNSQENPEQPNNDYVLVKNL